LCSEFQNSYIFFSLSAGLREWFAQSDERNAHPRIPVMVNMSSTSVSSKKNQKPNDFSVNPSSLDQMNAASRNSALIDEYSDDEDFQIAESEQEVVSTFSLMCILGRFAS